MAASIAHTGGEPSLDSGRESAASPPNTSSGNQYHPGASSPCAHVSSIPHATLDGR